MPKNRPLNVRQTAELLRVSDKTIRNWINREGLPCTRGKGGQILLEHGRVIRWALDQVENENPWVRTGLYLVAPWQIERQNYEIFIDPGREDKRVLAWWK